MKRMISFVLTLVLVFAVAFGAKVFAREEAREAADEPATVDDIATLSELLTYARAKEKIYEYGEYTDASWDALQAAITYAQTVLDDPNATHAQVWERINVLLSASNGLVNTIKGGLLALIAQARAVEKGNYTDASWSALQAAIAAAQAVVDDGNAIQAQVSERFTALQSAIDGLVENEDPPPPWWTDLPNWVQWILRWLCFGWLWMRF